MSQTYSPSASTTSRLPLLLTLLWGVLTLAAGAYALACGANTPVIDEWEFVGELVGQKPAGPWLWAQHNEHRLPLPKLVYLAQFRLTHDFRSGMLLVVAMMSGLSLALMRFAAHLRGRADWADAFFPVSLLHVGHWENFLLGYQICFALFAVLVMGLVVVALQATRATAFRSGVLASALLLLVALTGGSGLVLVPPVACWLVYLVAIVWRGGERGRAVALAVATLLPVAYLVLYFANFHRPPDHPPPSGDIAAIATVAGQVLAMALGVGVSGVWWLVALGILALGVATVALVVRRATDPAERPASVGLLVLAVGVVGIALAIGVGRSEFGPNAGLWSRYAFLTWPLLGAAFLVWVKAGGGAEPRGLVKWIPAGLCVAAALAFVPNMGTGMLIGAGTAQRYAAMEIDLQAGMTDEQLIRKYFPESRDEGQEERARWAIPMLREAGIGLFATGEARGHSQLWRLGALAGLVGVGFVLRWLWHLGRAVQAERARELFRLQHGRFEEMLVKAASASGLPRGLRWLACEITGDAILVRDTSTNGIVALVPVVIQFEPISGSDMEDVPAARDPRPATAVFTFARGTWETTGRVVFNHTPDQAVTKFSPQFRVIHHGHH